MLKYIIRRIIAMIPVVIGITFLVFMIMQLAPGDPVQMILGDNASPEAVEAMRDEMGLNDNVLVQYLSLIHIWTATPTWAASLRSGTRACSGRISPTLTRRETWSRTWEFC